MHRNQKEKMQKSGVLPTPLEYFQWLKAPIIYSAARKPLAVSWPPTWRVPPPPTL